MFVTDPGTRKQERLRAFVENPRRRRFWAARSRRRQAVVALALVTAAASAVFAASIGIRPPYGSLLVVAFAVLLLGAAVLGTQLNVAARWVAGYEGVDEFQRTEMDRATLLGHHVTAVLLTLVVAVTCGFGGWAANGDMRADVAFMVLVPLVLVTAMCHAAFPACHLAWTRPDEILDEEDEKV